MALQHQLPLEQSATREGNPADREETLNLREHSFTGPSPRTVSPSLAEFSLATYGV
jgi:hypothetical protein